MTPTKVLTFSAVDELGFAAARGLLDDPTQLQHRYSPNRLGPLLELLILAKGGHLPPGIVSAGLTPNGAAPLIQAIRDNREHWLSPENRRMGIIRAHRKGPTGDSIFTSFLMAAIKAARDVAGLPGSTPGQLAAAMEELENNIHEHSDAAETGILAFRAERGLFEFVAADLGIGILSSLKRSGAYYMLSDHGAALEAALKDGTSRFGAGSKRGHGFRPIFIGLVNLRGALRFRSGDHALLMDGTSPDLTKAQLAQKPLIGGFLASIVCKAA